MSHFTVAVLTDEDTTVEELLAPYDEGITVDRYIRHTREELIRDARQQLERVKNSSYAEYQKSPAEYLEKHCGGDPNNAHYRYISYEFAKRYNMNDEELLAQELSYYDSEDIDEQQNIWSTYNPKSKWDWYSDGGRFFGMLRKYDSDEEFNSLPAKDIDFLKMAQHEAETATPYEEVMKDSFYNPAYLKRLYPDKETYELIRNQFWTRAVVTPDGEWHELGQMGWFGMSSEEPEETVKWVRDFYKTFMKPAIDYDWTVNIIDCHI